MNDLLTFAAEIAEERAAICEFDGLLTRSEAEKQGLLESERWRHACEVRQVMSIPSLAERRTYLSMVETQRGKEAANKLREDIQREWLNDRMKIAGQA